MLALTPEEIVPVTSTFVARFEDPFVVAGKIISTCVDIYNEAFEKCHSNVSFENELP